MRTEIHPLRLPRLATGVVGRSKEVERLAVHDTVPIGIPHLSPAEAPVAFRTRAGVEHRAFEGLAYEPVGQGTFEDAWGALFQRIEPFLLHQIGMGPYVSLDPIQTVTGWGRRLDGAARKRGFGPAEGLRVREVHEDGRVAQAASARAIAGRLAMVGDTLMLRTGLPRIRYKIYEMDGGPAASALDEAVLLRWDEDDVGQPLGVDDFRIDRRDEAAAYASLLRERLGIAGLDRAPGFEVVDGDALAACYGRVAPEADLGSIGVANGVVLAMMPVLAHYPDEQIAGYLDLKRLAARGDGAGIRSWMETLPAIRESTERAPWVEPNGPYHKKRALLQIDRAAVRHTEIEVPKANLSAGDEAALSAFGR